MIDEAGKTAIAYGVYGVPETFFIDTKGQIVAKHAGPLNPRSIEEYLQLWNPHDASLVLIAAVSLPDVSAVVGQPQSTPLSGERLEAHTERLSDIIRCPVCQGSSVGDSPSEMARNMKQQVKELLALGFNDEQIIQYFEASYGEFIRLEPRREGINLLVWIAPYSPSGYSSRPKAPSHFSGLDQTTHPRKVPYRRMQPRSWILTVREQVYGWPQGIPPDEDAT